MRFLMTYASAAKAPPTPEHMAAIAKFSEEMTKAGVLLMTGGLQRPTKGTQLRMSGGKFTVTDGPFAETKELIAGYWIINVKSLQEAIDWARRVPNPHGGNQEGEIEIRPFFELEDFAPSEAIARHRELGQELAKKKGA